MEPVSLGLGVLPLFSACLEYFRHFKTATALSQDYQILLLKFDFEHERLIIWGERHGIHEVQSEGRNPQLDMPDDTGRINKVLELLKTLLESKENLEAKYGVIAVLPDGEKNETRTQGQFMTSAALKRFWSLKAMVLEKTSKPASNSTVYRVIAKTQWAVQDKEKFSALVNDVRDLVTGLYDILPVPASDRDRLAIQDIRSLFPDARRLRQIEIASKELYPTWSEAASIVATVSEMGSTDARSHGEVDSHRIEELLDAASNAAQVPKGEIYKLCSALEAADRQKRYFVFTAECLSNGPGVPCDTKPIHSLFLDRNGPCFTATHSNVTWSIGRSVTSSIAPKFDPDALEILRTPNFE